MNLWSETHPLKTGTALTVSVCAPVTLVKTHLDAATYRRIAKVDLRIPAHVSPEARDVISKVGSSPRFRVSKLGMLILR